MNKADIEFYESKAVMAIAKVIAKKAWNDCSASIKKKSIEAAIDICYLVINEKPFSSVKIVRPE